MKKNSLFLPIVLILTFLSSCATQKKDLNTAEGLYAYAEEFAKAERFEMAISKFNEVKNKFPYSKLATEAELAVADINFERESYSEAEVLYQNFKDLHPKHPKIDYVVYRIALSSYKQLPETIDRDLSIGNEAIYNYNELIKNYPQSEYLLKAKEQKEEILKKMAEKELYVADFYLKMKEYKSAYARYASLFTKYTGLGLDPRAHLGAYRAALQMNEKGLSQKHLDILQKEFPQSSETKSLQKSTQE